MVATARKISTPSLTIDDIVDMFYRSGHRCSVGGNDFVFDVYKEGPSPRDSKRLRREVPVSYSIKMLGKRS